MPSLSPPLSPTLYPTLSLLCRHFCRQPCPHLCRRCRQFCPTFVENFVTIFATIFVANFIATFVANFVAYFVANFFATNFAANFSPPSGMSPAFHYLSLFMWSLVSLYDCIATVPLRISSKWRLPEIHSLLTGSAALFTGLQHIILNKNLLSGDCWASDKVMWIGMLFLTFPGHELCLKLDKEFQFNELRERNLSYSHTTLLHGKERTMTTCILRRPRALL